MVNQRFPLTRSPLFTKLPATRLGDAALVFVRVGDSLGGGMLLGAPVLIIPPLVTAALLAIRNARVLHVWEN